MKKSIFVLGTVLFVCSSIFAQSSDDDFFFDDGIDELVVETDSKKSELNHGTLFENGSIKIGGTFTTTLDTSTRLWSEDKDNFAENLKETTLTPTASAFLSVDARPTQTLRMYTKFGLAYPFKSSASSSATTTQIYGNIYGTSVSTSVVDFLKVKELFTDFSVADRAFFRFGLHTVTWGTGYFFSPVSDMINSTSIDPENTSAQVDGALNLRTQITFPGTQNCLWFYIIPDGVSLASNSVNLIDTALAGKADLVFGGWEFGLGAYYKYQHAPKAMVTTSGSLKKLSFFSEVVYSYGAASEWAYEPDSWKNKTSILQGTAGISYFWKEPKITLAAQYYYNGYDSSKEFSLMDAVKFAGDFEDTYFTKGHNFAVVANFGRIFGTSDLTATIFAMGNYGKDDLPPILNSMIDSSGLSTVFFSTATVSAMLNYSPFNGFTAGVGPYVTFKDWESKPDVTLKMNFTLGGGKF